ncbi:LytTR family DNA-binding domain-containing protein [Paenibacillus tarimensis]
MFAINDNVFVLVFDDEDNMHKIDLKDVLCIRRDEKTRKIIIATDTGQYYLPSTMKHLDDFFSPRGFFQIDRNKIINISKIDNFRYNEITVNDSVYTVATRKRKELFEILESN